MSFVRRETFSSTQIVILKVYSILDLAMSMSCWAVATADIVTLLQERAPLEAWMFFRWLLTVETELNWLYMLNISVPSTIALKVTMTLLDNEAPGVRCGSRDVQLAHGRFLLKNHRLSWKNGLIVERIDV